MTNTQNENYPRLAQSDENKRDYRDESAVDLYKEAGGSSLVRVHQKMISALEKQADKLIEFHSTPFTKNNLRVMAATIEGIITLESQLERWHFLMYPNQKPKDGSDVG